MPVPVPAHLRRAPGAAARALASLGLVLILTACELDPTAAPPVPTRTPQPPPALSPVATSQGQTTRRDARHARGHRHHGPRRPQPLA